MAIWPILPYKLPVKYAAAPKTRISAIRIIALSVGPSVTPILLGVGCTMAIVYLPCIYFPSYEDLVGCATFPLRTQRDLDMSACLGKRPRPGLMLQAGVLIGHRGPGDDIDEARVVLNSQPKSHNCGKPQCNWRRRPWTSYRLSSIEICEDRPRSWVQNGAVVQTFATDAAKCSGTLCGLCGENCIPDFWRGFAIDAKLSERELTFPDPMHEFNAGDGDRGAPKALQSKHWTQTKFDRSMVLLYQII